MPRLDGRGPADAAIDRAWGAFHGRLVAYAYLPADRYKESAQAAHLVRTLFPDGLAFLRLPTTPCSTTWPARTSSPRSAAPTRSTARSWASPRWPPPPSPRSAPSASVSSAA